MEANQRVERQREKQRHEEMLKKEMMVLKQASKDFNRERASRKREY